MGEKGINLFLNIFKDEYVLGFQPKMERQFQARIKGE